MVDHHNRAGRCINAWVEVLPALETASSSAGRDLRLDGSRNLVDPTGVPYKLNREKCVAEINWPTSKIPPV
jgi:hypothetical protein